MESLNNYITERIRVDNLKTKFPNTSSIEEMIEFLKEHDFVDVTDERFFRWDQIVNALNKCKSKCYTYKRYIHPRVGGVVASLKFADTTNGNISRKNPLFLCNEINNEDNRYKLCYDEYEDKRINHNEFIDAVNKNIEF